MGMLVRQWIIEKLGLPVPEYEDSSNFRRGLSNGFIIAEILRKYSIISDDQLIALGHNFTEGTKLKNMKYVHRWMLGAGIDCCDLPELLDVAEEKSGAVNRFLYKLYFSLEGIAQRRGSLDPSSKNVPTPADFLPDFDYGIDIESVSEMRLRLAQDETNAQLIGVLDDVLQDLDGRSLSNLNLKGEIGEGQEDVVAQGQVCPSPQKDPDEMDAAVGNLMYECPLAVGSVPHNVSDTRDVANFYFAKNSKFHVKNEKLKITVDDDEEEDGDDDGGAAWMDSLKKIDFSGIEETERVRLMGLKQKLEREAQAVREMGAFDAKLDEVVEAEKLSELERKQRTLFSDGQQSYRPMSSSEKMKIHPRNAEPVRASPVDMQTRLNRLKCDRKEEQVATEERVRFRRALCSKMIKRIPALIHEDLVSTALAKTTAICGKEIELSEFLISSYRPLDLFLDHVVLEESELHALRCNRSDRLAQEKARKESLDRLTSGLLDKRSQRVEDERSEKEMALLLNIINHQLNMMIRLVTRIGDYRQMTGEDPSPEQIAEWKSWLLLGLETPPEPVKEVVSSESEEFEFNLADMNCRIVLSENPIPTELRPRQSVPKPTPSLIPRPSEQDPRFSHDPSNTRLGQQETTTPQEEVKKSSSVLSMKAGSSPQTRASKKEPRKTPSSQENKQQTASPQDKKAALSKRRKSRVL